ncbi:unnamed protein product [Heligmosomoides polygyrus]|uniref:Ash family protein n=1 Tax=Heligmosomoides polygyrus TaxID=6339 RepID=A0A183GFJ1_HELPZ|nr:unnamed protein product [Heligmosomoides polygyrus]
MSFYKKTNSMNGIDGAPAGYEATLAGNMGSGSNLRMVIAASTATAALQFPAAGERDDYFFGLCMNPSVVFAQLFS